MTSALYARVSTADQNPESQLAQIRRYAEARGWKVYGEYVDTASGAVASRPRLDALMADAAAHRFEAVLVWKFDRLFRSVQHMMAALDRFRTLGIDFVSVTECIDTSTAMGQMVFTLLAGIAQFERALIIERTQIGMARARAQGKHIGRPRVVISPENQQEALRLWNGGKGMSIRQLAKKFDLSHSKMWELLKQGVLKRTETISGHPEPSLPGSRQEVL